MTAKGEDLHKARANAYEATKWIDFENKYGDGVGTVYLLADYDSSLTRQLSVYYSSYSSSNAADSTMKINQMNPLWAATRGNSSVTWNNNEKSAAYLCDTTQWSSYANTSDENIRNIRTICNRWSKYRDVYRFI